MPIGKTLADFQTSLTQCDSLIANAHRVDATGISLFPQRDREQITVAAFLNLFIALEEYIETSISDFMMGDTTSSGAKPVRYVIPSTREHSNNILIHTQRYFDYSNHDNVRKIISLYFHEGYPFEIPLKSINAELSELKIMRNACAHVSSTTKKALESLATRILGMPRPGISVYELLTAVDPREPGAATTVYAAYRDKLLAAAGLIAKG